VRSPPAVAVALGSCDAARKGSADGRKKEFANQRHDRNLPRSFHQRKHWQPLAPDGPDLAHAHPLAGGQGEPLAEGRHFRADDQERPPDRISFPPRFHAGKLIRIRSIVNRAGELTGN